PAPARRLGAAVSRIPTRFAPTAVGEWLFVSDFIRRRAEEAAGALPGAGVLHSGIDRSFVAAAPERPWAWRLLCVGRIDARKGVDTAIDALARLPEEATLTVVGEGDEEHLAALRTRAAPFGDRVMFVGARPRAELPAIFAKHDAVLFPVRWEEPWGLVPLEAMGTGRPVVATAGGGSVEYLRDGENAIVAPADDAEAFAAAVRRLAGDPAERARLRDGGSITAREHTADRFEAGVVAALERAAGRRG
ncbi:MAG TPA: glycosyltransferase family 4 protein, partial [Solirubrobacteraceae bacterium]